MHTRIPSITIMASSAVDRSAPRNAIVSWQPTIINADQLNIIADRSVPIVSVPPALCGS